MLQALVQGVASADGRLLSARIVLQGRTELHSRLVTDVENLVAEARAAALGLGDELPGWNVWRYGPRQWPTPLR